MLNIRPARPGDSGTLTEIAMRSEAHWGYDAAFMETFRAIYGVTEDFLARHPAFVAEEDGAPCGFYAMNGNELEYLFLEPRCLGRGLGRRLWQHMATYCRERGLDEITLVCGPQPKDFYLKMGAIAVGDVESLVTPGRKVSKLVYRIP